MKEFITYFIEKGESSCGICGGSLAKEIAELKTFYETPKGIKPFKKRKFIDIDIDHVVPKSKGGVTELFNLHLTHRSCNQRKGSKPLLFTGLNRNEM